MKNNFLYKTSLVLFILLNNIIYSQCFTNASAGYANTIGIKPNGSIWGWGFGNWGQLNNGTSFDEYTPIQLSNQNNWKLVKNYYANTFAIKNDGTLWVCGYNLYGELGIGSNSPNSDTFVQVGTASNWKDVVSSQSQTIALKTDNTLWGWGQNDSYQVGNNNCCGDVLSPVAISTDTDWKTITVNQVRTSFALKNNGTLWGWGANGANLLGDSSVSVYQVPTQISVATDWSDISAGLGHVLALKTNGTLWAWGDSYWGEAGYDGPNIGNPYLSSIPNQIQGNWSKITAGINFSLGIKTNGTLWAWGKNDIGQLGNGTTTNTYIPVQVGTDTDWVSVSAGSEHVVALKSNGALYTWGGNYYGELGNGTTTGVATPTNVPVAGCALANESFTSSYNDFTINPNPVQNELNLTYKGTDVINTISIYDITGKELFTTQPVATTTLMANFSIAELQCGSYIVVLKNNGKTIVSKQLVKE